VYAICNLKFLQALTKLTSTSRPLEESKQEKDTNVAEDEEPVEDDSSSDDQDEDDASPVSSTTEVPKKKLVGSVRPFRSQQDLIASLKRRRQMVQQQGYTVSVS